MFFSTAALDSVPLEQNLSETSQNTIVTGIRLPCPIRALTRVGVVRLDRRNRSWLVGESDPLGGAPLEYKKLNSSGTETKSVQHKTCERSWVPRAPALGSKRSRQGC